MSGSDGNANGVFGNKDNGSGVDGDAFGGGGQDNGSQLVGPGKKFKTYSDLEKGKLEADAFIERLKSEKAELLAHAQAMEKLAKDLQSGAGSGNAGGTPAAKPSDVDLSAVVNEVLEQRTAEQRRTENLNSAVSTLVGIHGSTDEVRKVIAKKAGELGMTTEALKNMAAESPRAFLAVVGVADGQKPSATPSSTAGTGNASRAPAGAGQSGVKNQTYYNNLRKELGAKFWDARVQNEMFKARQELGAKFYE